MFQTLQSLPIPLLLLIATTLEVSGDATVRLAIYQHTASLAPPCCSQALCSCLAMGLP